MIKNELILYKLNNGCEKILCGPEKYTLSGCGKGWYPFAMDRRNAGKEMT